MNRMLINDVVIFGLSASTELANKVCKELKIEKGKVSTSRFKDGEILTTNGTSVRGKSVYVIQSTSTPVNDNLMELLIFLDSLKRASAKEVNVIIPYYGYARQDRKVKGRQPITAKLVADLISHAGANRIITFDLHAPQIQGFFNIPVDDLKTTFAFAKKIKQLKIENLTIVAPDYGGIKRARELAILLEAELAIIDKRRPKANVAKIMNILGDVKKRNCLIIDDIVDTGGTIIRCLNALLKEGANSVSFACTHPVMSGEAVKNLQNSAFNQIIFCDTIQIEDSKKRTLTKMKQISISNFLAKVINAQQTHGAVSDIYDEEFNKVIK